MQMQCATYKANFQMDKLVNFAIREPNNGGEQLIYQLPNDTQNQPRLQGNANTRSCPRVPPPRPLPRPVHPPKVAPIARIKSLLGN